MSTASLVNRMHHIDCCIESIEWVQEAKLPDMATAWAAMDQPQWMCWVTVRVLGTSAVKGLVAAMKPLRPLLPPPALATLDAALAHADGKQDDEEGLLVAAFDATGHALHVAGAAGSALMAVSYVAHAAVKLRQAAVLQPGPEQTRLSLRAAAHAADALLHLLIAVPDAVETLPAVIRANIDERKLSKAWHALPDKPPPKAAAAGPKDEKHQRE